MLHRNTLSSYEIERLHQLYMQAPVAVGIYLGEQHIIEFANPVMCEIWGRTPDKIINKPLFEALPEVSRQGFEEILAEVLQTGEPFSGKELPATLQRNGEVRLFYFNILYKPLKDANNNIIGIVQVATEVTDLVEARIKAERNEEIMKIALEGGKIGSWHYDYTQNTFTRSIEHDKIFGYSKLQGNWTEDIFFHHVLPEDHAIAIENYEKGIKDGILNYEVRIRRTDGKIHWINLRGKTSYNLKGKPVSMSGIIMDITSQKQNAEKERQLAIEKTAREEAEKHSRLLEELFMEAPALICTLIGPDYIFELVNPAYQAIFPNRQLIGKKLLDALPEVEGQPVHNILDHVYHTGEAFVGKEVPVELDRFNNGQLETTYFTFIYKAMYDSQGQINGIIVFGFDVTEQVLARKRAESSEESLRIALEAGKMGTWHLDLASDTSIRSLQYDKLFGYDRLLPDWGVKKLLEHILPEDHDKVISKFEEAKITGEYKCENRIVTTDNKIRWIAGRGKTFYEDGQAVRMAGVVMDITERKEAEERLKKLSEELKSSNTELLSANKEINAHMEELSRANHQLKLINSDLDNFIYTASHDLKAPIANIEGLMSLLSNHLSVDTREKEVVKKTLQMIDASIIRFKKTIMELTDIARLQKGEEDISFLRLEDILDEVLLDLDLMIKESGTQLDIDLNTNAALKFSHKNLKSVIYNLVSNAIKYRSPDRKPIISIASYEADNYQILSISDNGLGIKDKNLVKIFSMFTRLHTHVEGSGVGLYLVKRIIDNVGGKLEVQSKEGRGSVFKVHFPLSKEEEKVKRTNEKI